jgi:hypothetical protein
LDGLPDGCTILWNRLSSTGPYCQDEVALELPNGIGVECGVYRYKKFFRVDVVFTKWGWWHTIEHSWCRTAVEAAAEIVRLSNKYMDDGLLTLAREISHHRMGQSDSF